MKTLLVTGSVCLLLFGAPVWAQSIGIGVKGGVRATDDFQPGMSGGDYATSESKRYLVGPMVTVGLPLGFTAEFDALYRHVAFRTSNSYFFGDFYTQRGTAASWEFPMLVRHKLIGGLYGGIGYAPRIIHGASHVNQTYVSNPTETGPIVYGFNESTRSDPWRTTQGLVLVGGFEKRLGRIGFSPEARYTHWSRPSLLVEQSHGYGYRTAQEQVDIAIGITFHPFGGR